MTISNRRDIRVLHVVSGLLPGGLELMLSHLVTGLTKPGFRHSVACLKGEAVIRDRFPPSTSIFCLRSTPNEPTLPWRLWRLIHRLRPTVIHASNWAAWPDIAVARLITWPMIPLIFCFHGTESAGPMPLRRRLAFRALSRITTHLLTVSDASKRMLVRDLGWPVNRVGVIPNGVDTARYRPGRMRTRRRRFVVGTAGRLSPVKNHPLLLRACAAAIERGLDAELLIAGQGKLREHLRDLAQSLGIADRLRLPGFVTDVPAFLRRLDLFVLTSDAEQHPLALIEAMACGLPCVATRVGSVDAVLDGGRCGRIVEPRDASSLAAEILELAGDRDLRWRLGRTARQHVCRNYSMEQMIAAYEDLYRRLSATRNGGRRLT